jgi:hypothetical protein
MANIVIYRSRSVNAEDYSVMGISVGESTANVSVYWRIHEL